MCTALLLFASHPHLLLLLVFNRDEYLTRPTEPTAFWKDKDGLLAGRDRVGGGTWLGVTRSGRFALVTNFREVAYDALPNSPSRGALPVYFLEGQQTPLAYLQSLKPQDYNGVNLVVGDLAGPSAAYLSNRVATRPTLELQPGLYGLSNAILDEPWPKVCKGKAALQELLDGTDDESVPWEEIFRLVSSTEKAPDNELPQTGLGDDVERAFSSLFIEPMEMPGGLYGTRSQQILAVHRSGRAELRERYIDQDMQWRNATHSFCMQAGEHCNAGCAS